MTKMFIFQDNISLLCFAALFFVLKVSCEGYGQKEVLRRSKRQIQVPGGYDMRQAPKSNLITVTLINKSGRVARLYQSGVYGMEIIYQFTLRPNEPKTIQFLPDGSFWSAYDSRTSKELLINGRRRLETYYIRPGFHFNAKIHSSMLRPDEYPIGKVAPKYVEVLVILDPSMIEHYGESKVENYVHTLMNVATRAYMERSLGVPIFIAVIGIEMMKDVPPYYSIVEDKPDISVRGGCRFARTFFPIYNHDFALILTRKEIGPSGFASMYTMCTRRSCGLVKDSGLDSGYVIAHELAHALGVDHDEDDKCTREKRGTNIMARKLFATNSNFRWSRCSGRMLRQNLKYFPCLKNKPKMMKPFLENMMRLPGEYLNLTEQCQIYHGNHSRTCRTPFINGSCRYLLCTVGEFQICRPTKWHSPLEGTNCNDQKGHWCLRGRCIDKKSILPVNGNWTKWSDFDPPCDKSNETTVMLMVQTRQRNCTNPRPRNGGKKCVGDSLQYRVVIPYGNGVCKPYSLENVVSRKKDSGFHRSLSTLLNPDVSDNMTNTISNQELAAGHLKHRNSMMFPCSSSDVKGKIWEDYPPFLQSQYLKTVNLSCDFETPGCGWRSSKRGDKPWSLGSGGTPSYETGPKFDHTLKNKKGKYIYLEASYVEKTRPLSEGDRIILESPLIISSSICLRFAYHMRGRTMGSLEVRVRNGRYSRKMWSKSGHQGDQWHTAEIQLDMNIEYNITIEAIKGSSYNSDIAIDDILVTPGSCKNGSQIADECTTMCVDENYTSMLRLQLPNGTPCKNPLHRNNACLKKKCVPVNCEGILGKSDC